MHEATMVIYKRMLRTSILEVTVLDQKHKMNVTLNKLHIPLGQIELQSWFPNPQDDKVFNIDDGEWISLDPMTVTQFTNTLGE